MTIVLKPIRKPPQINLKYHVTHQNFFQKQNASTFKGSINILFFILFLFNIFLGFERVESQEFGQLCRLFLRRENAMGRDGISVRRSTYGRRHGDDDEGATDRSRVQRGTRHHC